MSNDQKHSEDREQRLRQIVMATRNLNFRDKAALDQHLAHVKSEIAAICGEDSHPLKFVNRIQFAPESFYSSANEYERAWYGGLNEIINLCNVLLEDCPGAQPEALLELPPEEPSEDDNLHFDSVIDDDGSAQGEPAEPEIPEEGHEFDKVEEVIDTITSKVEDVLSEIDDPEQGKARGFFNYVKKKIKKSMEYKPRDDENPT